MCIRDRCETTQDVDYSNVTPNAEWSISMCYLNAYLPTVNSKEYQAVDVLEMCIRDRYNGDLTTLKNEVIAKVVTQGMSVEDGMAYFDQQGGNNWSQKIVDSLNN